MIGTKSNQGVGEAKFPDKELLMKLKSTTDLPEYIVEALNSAVLAQRVVGEVASGILGLDNPGPAEAFVQMTDIMVRRCDEGFGCVVQMTGVSANRKRATVHFEKARDVLFEIYREVIATRLPKGQRFQLYVMLFTDKAPFECDSPLFERCAWHEGEWEET